QADDRDLESLLMRGMRKIFPDLRPADLAYSRVHRAKFVQPLPLVQHPGENGQRGPATFQRTPPFQVLNTSMLRCATLNNDEVVAFVDQFVARTQGSWTSARGQAPSVTLGDQV